MNRKLDIGSRLGPFEITGRIGSGGAGSVFSAKNIETGKEVALKTMLSASAVNEEIHSRFIREIAIAQRLNHPNIVAYDDCGIEKDLLYYTMDHVPWGPLSDVLVRRRRLNWRDAAECGIQICKGLAHLHEADIVHRDLKPANIFLSDDGKLKLGDFGLARDLGSFRLTMDGKTVGTAKYLAPEQARGRADLDGRTDLYSLGCIMFEMLAGQTPFVDVDAYSQASYFEMIKRHVEEAPPSLTEFVTNVPVALTKLVAQLLEKAPEDRPMSAAIVSAILEEILAGREVDEVSEPGSDDNEQTEPRTLTERLHEDVGSEVSVDWLAIGGIVALVVVGLIYAAASKK